MYYQPSTCQSAVICLTVNLVLCLRSLSLVLTLEDGANVFPDGDTPTAVKLAQSQFHVEQRHATKHSHQQVRQEKGT